MIHCTPNTDIIRNRTCFMCNTHTVTHRDQWSMFPRMYNQHQHNYKLNGQTTTEHAPCVTHTYREQWSLATLIYIYIYCLPGLDANNDRRCCDQHLAVGCCSLSEGCVEPEEAVVCQSCSRRMRTLPDTTQRCMMLSTTETTKLKCLYHVPVDGVILIH